jgi:hypothetical protein
LVRVFEKVKNNACVYLKGQCITENTQIDRAVFI